MQRIGTHISELLFDHDCVIVPLLGGFLASNEHARLLPNSILYPPYRRIAFNVYLKQNDGLLANHLVETEGISYSAANNLLEEFTFECIQNLEQGKKVNIEQVGTIYFDQEKNIQFEAYRNINHRKDSFGMEPVHLIPVARDVQEEKQKPVQKIQKKIRPSVTIKRPFISQKGRRIIGIAAVVGVVIWLSVNLDIVAPKKYEATMNPFDSQVAVNEQPVKDSAPVITEEVKPGVDTMIAQTDSSLITQNDSTLIADNIPVKPEPVVIEKIVPKVEETPVSQPVLTGTKHYVIAGVFKIKENAVSLVATLQSSGYKNAQLIEANGRNYVSYQEFSTTEEACAMADSIHKHNMEGWIWKH